MVYQASEYIKSQPKVLYTPIEYAIDTRLQTNGICTFDLERYPIHERNNIYLHILDVYSKAGWKVERHNYEDFREHWDQVTISLLKDNK